MQVDFRIALKDVVGSLAHDELILPAKVLSSV